MREWQQRERERERDLYGWCEGMAAERESCMDRVREGQEMMPGRRRGDVDGGKWRGDEDGGLVESR